MHDGRGKNADEKPHNRRLGRLEQSGCRLLKLTLKGGPYAPDPDQEKIKASGDPKDFEYG